MKLLKLLSESLRILRLEPKLFLPKVVIALLFGLLMVGTANLITSFLPAAELLPPISKKLDSARGLQGEDLLSWMRENLTAGEVEAIATVQKTFPFTVALLVFTLLMLVLDIIVNAMYPLLVKDFFAGKSPSLAKALRFSLSKSARVVPPVLLIGLLFSLPLSLLYQFSLYESGLLSLPLLFIIALPLSFLIAVMFYLLYPVLVLGQKSVVNSLKECVSMSRQQFRVISLASLIPFSISLANFALAFLVSNLAMLLLFLALRFLIAVIATYHMVLNPTIYLEAS